MQNFSSISVSRSFLHVIYFSKAIILNDYKNILKLLIPLANVLSKKEMLMHFLEQCLRASLLDSLHSLFAGFPPFL